jgi:hypothetical protein
MSLPSAISPALPELVDRVRSEYLEMPGLALTVVQARRLWNLEGALCDAVLMTLVREAFLARSKAGTYFRPAAR